MCIHAFWCVSVYFCYKYTVALREHSAFLASARQGVLLIYTVALRERSALWCFIAALPVYPPVSEFI